MMNMADEAKALIQRGADVRADIGILYFIIGKRWDHLAWLLWDHFQATDFQELYTPNQVAL